MSYSKDKMEEFVALLERHVLEDGIQATSIPEFGLYRATKSHARRVEVCEAALLIAGQGKKHCYLGGKKYDYSAGNYLIVLLPMPIEIEAVEVSPEKPLLMAGVRIDLIKIANILQKMEQVDQQPVKSEIANFSAIVSEPLNDALLEPIIKLFHTLDNPVEQAVLGELILEEIYFRIICNDQSGSLRRLLQHRGQVQRISKAVDYIHHHLDEVVSVDELAETVNMSPSHFRKMFKEVMHLPPLQYAKSIKLDRAQNLLQGGKNASEAGYLVGYNSPSQFSREYKRHFGFAPSAT